MLVVEAKAPPLQADQDGVIRVGDTRVTLDTVVHAFQQGHSAEEIASHYPSLKLADVYAVIAYYLDNHDSVNDYLRQQEAEVEDFWYEIETDPNYKLFRERLLAKYQATQQTT